MIRRLQFLGLSDGKARVMVSYEDGFTIDHSLTPTLSENGGFSFRLPVSEDGKRSADTEFLVTVKPVKKGESS